jgi:hypothetical protein
MTSKQLYFLLLGLIGLLFIGTLVGTYGANQLLTTRATTLTSLKAKSMALTQEQAGLNGAKKEVQRYSSLETITKAVVPQDKNQAEAVREIANLAQRYNLTLTSITFPVSTLGNTTSTGTSTASSAAASSSSSSATAPTSSPVNNLSQLQPVKGILGVYQLPITILSDANHPVSYTALLNFLTALEHNRRTAQISNLSITPSPNNLKLLTFTLTLNEYIKP